MSISFYLTALLLTELLLYFSLIHVLVTIVVKNPLDKKTMSIYQELFLFLERDFLSQIK